MIKKYLQIATCVLSLTVTATFAFANDDLEVAQQLSNSGEFAQAAQMYTKALSSGENASQEVRIMAGVNALAAGRIEEANNYVNPIIKINPSNAAALHLKAQVLISQGKLKRARGFVVDAVTFDSQVILYRTTLMLLDAKLGSFSDAVHQTTEILKIDPNNTEALKLLVRYYVAQQNIPQVKALWEKIAKIDPSKENMYTYGQTLLQLGDTTGAEKVFRYTIQEFSDTYTAYIMLAELLYLDLRYEAAIRMYNVSLTKSEIVEEVASSHGMISRSYFKMGQLESARESTQTALTLNPNDYEANLTKGKLALQDKEFDKAKSIFLALEEKERLSDPEFYFSLAMVNESLDPTNQEIDEGLAKARELAPRDPEYVLFEVVRLLYAGHTALADQTLRSCFENIRKNTDLSLLSLNAYALIGNVYEQGKDYENALKVRLDLLKSGVNYEGLKLSVFDLYLKLDKVLEAEKFLVSYRDSFDAEEVAALEVRLIEKKKPLPDNPEEAINKQ